MSKKVECIPIEDLLNAYASGWFPMADHKDGGPIFWYEPEMRGIIPMDAFKAPKTVRRFINQQRLSFSINKHFEKVIRACADREESWISESIIQSYCNLHKHQFALSVEVYDAADTAQQNPIGGLYGVILRNAFFGESMFKKAAEADKAALVYCHNCLEEMGIILWDTQYYTDHLAQFGAIEIPQSAYLARLKKALNL